MNIKEAINVISALDVKSEYEAIAKEMILSGIEQLTNNWNELEEFIQKELDNNADGIKSFSGYQCKIILDKMKEIKEKN